MGLHLAFVASFWEKREVAKVAMCEVHSVGGVFLPTIRMLGRETTLHMSWLGRGEYALHTTCFSLDIVTSMDFPASI